MSALGDTWGDWFFEIVVDAVRQHPPFNGMSLTDIEVTLGDLRQRLHCAAADMATEAVAEYEFRRSLALGLGDGD